MAAQRLRVGIIGTGFGAAVQLPAFLALPDAEVVGIASSNPQRSADLAKQYALPRSFQTYAELIAADDIDLVSIAAPPAEHARLVRAAIAVGKHILCEKPFTLNSTDAKALLKEANAAHIIHATDFEFRELPAISFLVSRLMQGAVGRIESATLSWVVGTWADPLRPWRWQCDKELGGGVLTALGVHLFNIAEFMLGPLGSMHAETSISVTERKDDTGTVKPVTSEDHAVVDLTGKYNVPVRIVVSNVDPQGKGFGIEIRGEKGVLLLESASQQYGSGLRVREGAEGKTKTILYEDPAVSPATDARVPPFQSLARRLLIALRDNERTFSPSFQDGVRSQFFLEGIRASVAERSWVDIGKGTK